MAQDTGQALLRLAMDDPQGFWRGVGILQQLGASYGSSGIASSGAAISAMAGGKPRTSGRTSGTGTATRGRPRGSGGKRRKSSTANTTTGGASGGPTTL